MASAAEPVSCKRSNCQPLSTSDDFILNTHLWQSTLAHSSAPSFARLPSVDQTFQSCDDEEAALGGKHDGAAAVVGVAVAAYGDDRKQKLPLLEVGACLSHLLEAMPGQAIVLDWDHYGRVVVEDHSTETEAVAYGVDGDYYDGCEMMMVVEEVHGADDGVEMM
jgi:hypothetical protein